MRLEIRSAANFLTGLLRLGNSLENDRLEVFRGKLEELLRHHYQHHWFPEKPFKGSGYRCIRINHKMDPILCRAGLLCGLNEASLRQLFPNELTMWIDPREVSYRIGENGSICVLYDGSKSDCFDPVFQNVHNSSTTSSSSPGGILSCYQNGNQSSPTVMERFPTARPSCKESMRANGSWDCFMMDPRNMNLEQLAAYVSS